MSLFFEKLDELNSDIDADERTWIYVPYDQVTDEIGPLSHHEPSELGIVMVETTWKGRRRPYHRQKLLLILANQRQFALEQARRGVAVDYRLDDRRYGEVLADACEDYGTLQAMRPAERELRADLSALYEAGKLEYRHHEGFLTSRETFEESQNGLPWRMDAFYRRVRQKSGILMDGDSPVGGKYSFDAENRDFWPGEPPAPDLPAFSPDGITAEVVELIEREFAEHPGELRPERLPTTADQADKLWQWALDNCMEHFGQFEDAMSTESQALFHTRISPLLNIHRLLPKRVVRDVAEADIPLNSKEGFIRQVLGWREFMRHVHDMTDGFRDLPSGYEDLPTESVSDSPGTGGWEQWQEQTWDAPERRVEELDEGAAPNFLEGDVPVPPAFWGEESGLRCLDEVVSDVWSEGWSHHITRLMVLSNIATLLGVSPRSLTDWFWVAYVDAFDWVVEPNVLGMGSFGLGDLFMTKPYVSGANYINKMSDYCDDCQFDPDKNCPLTSMYWGFLNEQEQKLSGNRRMGLMLGMMRKRSDDQKKMDQSILERVRRELQRGNRLNAEEFDSP
jgi:deoxyribodipyrimidine photolyase-related protein